MAPRDLKRLEAHVKARRLELGLAIKQAAADAGMSKDTWIRVERGAPVRDLNYAKIDVVLQWAPGSCQAVLEGRNPLPGRPAESDPDVTISAIPRGDVDEEARDVVQLAAIATTGLPADEIRALSDRVVHDLRVRGLI
jgi:transcriptional regulator with XRE-family HTH domain